jgi:hypothetical protein
VKNPELIDHILRQSRALVRALVRAIEALGTIQPTGTLNESTQHGRRAYDPV